MANPQLEDGHTRIANELMEQLSKLYVAPNQWQVLVCILRKTYGYHKKVDYITNTQLCQGTGLGKSTVSRAVRGLKQREIITRNGKQVGLQKDWELWGKLAVQATKVSRTDNLSSGKKLAVQSTELAVQSTELAELATKVSSPRDAQKEDTIQKKLSKRKRVHGEFQNVRLTDVELQKLEDIGAEAVAIIPKLSAYMKSTGKRYKSHYATILTWLGRAKEAKVGTNRHSRDLPTTYTAPPDYPDD